MYSGLGRTHPSWKTELCFHAVAWWTHFPSSGIYGLSPAERKMLYWKTQIKIRDLPQTQLCLLESH